ncbi:hypothetical protein AB0M02_21830 [Actinoplanes sp. NPDC051861]|uniref:hypothetical protein n=1 Tax=Actinoplanes sp. NPDC051861 TaxID=3155170 RepID=UPI0034363075
MTDHHDWHDDDFDFPDDVPDLHDHDVSLHDQPDLLDHWDDIPDTPDLPDIPDIPEIVETPDDTFPPALDIDLPEPVDGFPWIDPGSLGIADTHGFTPPEEPVTADELAAYAGTDIPPGADGWATLAADEDPATSALARWWTPGEQ